MKIIGIIPARYASTRFPGKPLIDIGGKTMIRRVYEQAAKSQLLTGVIVATDDERIFEEVKSFEGNVVMTASSHNNGTERCAEVAAQSDADVIINVQGDEPFVDPAQIDLLAALFKDASVQIATLIKAHPLNEELQKPARIKVVVNKNMEALYFSRNAIPSPHRLADIAGTTFYKHLGIYGYRKDVLREIVKLGPTPLELAESLEQLRWLENGYKIKCAVTESDSISIDTPEDLNAVSLLK
jgi:3-deoxy-manno-octulosonate cytidylyltransferase (CMP-KDO synthetase)